MKTTTLFLLVVLGWTTMYGQEDDRPVNTGDNFSLEGALAMFKNATSMKDFEDRLNKEDNNVNNLDLNDDGDIDYINVTDIKSGDSHIIVLSTYLNATEKQDIATIAIDKTGDAEAVLQIEGDKDLYAENTIIEPTEEKEIIKNAKDGGPSVPIIEVQTLVVNVWLWPCVRFIYAPHYVIWVSPYYWHHHPHWWHPWRPYTYVIFYNHCAPHRVWFHPARNRRVVAARAMYTPLRHTSTLVVHNRRGTTVIRRNNSLPIRGNRVPVRGNRVPTRATNPPIKRVPITRSPIKNVIIKGARVKSGGRR